MRSMSLLILESVAVAWGGIIVVYDGICSFLRKDGVYVYIVMSGGYSQSSFELGAIV